MREQSYQILEIGEGRLDRALDLLLRFFKKEGFGGDRSSIAANTRHMLADANHWIALAWTGSDAVGIVNVTTMLYVEWGRLGEIDDLYVLPEMRANGIGVALVEAAKAECRALGCSAVSVTITPDGEARHGLTRFYERIGFIPSGKPGAVHTAQPRLDIWDSP